MFLHKVFKSYGAQLLSTRNMWAYPHYQSVQIKSKKRDDIPNPLEEILHWVKAALYNIFPYGEEVVVNNIKFDAPPPYVIGDYMLSVFVLGRSFHQDPSYLAKRIEGYCSKEFFPLVKKVYAVGPYLNIEVDREIYYKKILDHIYDQGNLFGTHQQGNSQAVRINYLSNDLRASLIGQVIGRYYEWGGHTVFRENFTTDNARLVPIGRAVIRDALKYNVAKYIADTNVVTTSQTKNSPSLILQKQDKSLTRYTLYLAQERELIEKGQPSISIYISLMEQAEITESLIVNAKRLRYIQPKTNISTIFINETKMEKYISDEHRALHYAILRTPSHKKVLITPESLLVYSRLTDSIQQLREGYRENETADFDLAKLLVTFPMIVANIGYTHMVDKLCIYLEKILDLCQKQDIYNQDKRLSNAVAVVLQNGLDVLIS